MNRTLHPSVPRIPGSTSPTGCHLLFLLFVLLPSLGWGATTHRSAVTLEGTVARVVVDLAGGSIAEFRFIDSPLNPLDWGAPSPTETRPRGFAHFLCLDRWGPPSAAEGARGMPYHGEAAGTVWKRMGEPRSSEGVHEAELTTQLPIAGFSVRRQLRLSRHQAVCLVREDVTNDRPLGRIYNMVQHPTIGPPFLDATTLVDSNGRRGFAQGNPLPRPEEPSTYWPAALNRNGAPVNLRHLRDDPDPNVVSYAIDEPIGWVTAANPARGLLLGYLWKTSDYPWVSLWRDVKDGQPSARGLEFGSTGLHQPFPILVQVGRIWDRPVFDFLDAGETRSRAYVMFLLRIPGDFRGVERVRQTEAGWIIVERGTGAREIPLNAGADFLP